MTDRYDGWCQGKEGDGEREAGCEAKRSEAQGKREIDCGTEEGEEGAVRGVATRGEPCGQGRLAENVRRFTSRPKTLLYFP